MATVSPQSTEYDIKLDLQGLIRLLAKNLYAEPDVFVRELVQNAHDSIKRRREIEGDSAPEGGVIHIRTNREAGTITFTDNGIGLTEQEIHDYLSTIGRSGTAEFRDALMAKGRHADVTFIGQFGIGLLSAFVIADRVEVETKSLRSDSPPWLWISRGESKYELGPGSREQVGTTVTLHVTDSYRDMLSPDELRKAIKKYADFIPYGIFLNDEMASANAVNAPWHRQYGNEWERLRDYARFVDERFPDYALEVIPVSITTPHRVDGVLYVSNWHVPDMNTTGMVDIYQARMFIVTGSRDMLPEWAKFVRGVIDSPDLTPTAARDNIQQDHVARAIKEELGRVIVEHLKKLATTDQRRFETIMEWHSYHIKGMAVAYDDFFDAIADLVPFETNDGLMNLRRYIELAPKIDGGDIHNIYYFSERGSATQFYMLCNAKGLLVISAGYIFEEQFLKKYEKRRSSIRLHLISADGSILFDRLTSEEASTFRRLEADFERIMPDRHSQARVVRFKPTDLPAVTVLTPDAKLLEELRATEQNLVMPQVVRDLASRMLGERPTVPVVLHLNADNPTLKLMAEMADSPSRMGDSEAYRAAILALYNNAMLLAQHLLTPQDAQLTFASSNNAIRLMVEQTERLNAMQARLSAMEVALSEEKDRAISSTSPDQQSDHVLCMVAMPFKDRDTFPYDSVLLPALRQVLEQHPYYWQVVRADEAYIGNTVPENVVRWMKKADAYIADVSDMNPNVMMELGYMFWGAATSSRPLMVLEREGIGARLSDIGGLIRLNYPNAGGDGAIDEIVEKLREEIGRKEDVQSLNASKQAHYLSPLLLSDVYDVEDTMAQQLTRAYTTIENFVNASLDDIVRRIPAARRGYASGLQSDLRELLQGLHSTS